MNHKRIKALIIGLDGATFDILDPLIRNGRMPVLEKLMQNGAHGILKSTLPTNSFTAWASFMTGKNPGKHGIYDFRKSFKKDFYKKIVVTSKVLNEETMFQTFSRHKLKVGAFNVPLTYPPYEINGFMISGIVVPKTSREIFYPQHLYEEVTSRFGKYIANVSWNFYKNRIDDLVADISSMTEQRKEITLYLMKNYEPEVLAVVFVGPDRIQHPLLKYLFPFEDMPKELPDKSSLKNILDYYSLLDRCIGEIISEAGPNTNIFILSDHGFHLALKQFKVNPFLEKIGMLRFSKGKASIYNTLKKADIPYIRKIRRALFPHSGKYLKTFSASSAIDWTQTKAYSTLDIEQGISINLRGREPHGIVEPGEEFHAIRNHIKNRLLELTDPEKNQKVIKHVFFQEELFKGRYLSEAPDIVIEPSEYFYLGREKEKNLAELEWASGDHNRDGILIASGKDIVSGIETSGQKIIDLAPTILYSLSLPIPEDMDGRVLTELFKREFLKDNKIVSEKMERKHPVESDHKDLGETEQKELETKLKGLGYLD